VQLKRANTILLLRMLHPVVKVHVDELSSARICQHKLCATLFANVNINYRLSHQNIVTTVLVPLDISESN
jgi:hypothetical protein